MTDLTPADQLRAAKALIEDPDHWCRRVFARDKVGSEVLPTAASACQFCAAGALDHVTDRRDNSCAYFFLYRAADDCGNDSVASTNDDGGHSAVMRMYDRAIALAEADGS